MATKNKFAALSADLLARAERPAFGFDADPAYAPYLEPARVSWHVDPEPMAPRALTNSQAAAYVGVSTKTFSKLVEKGLFDAPLVLADERRWDRHALDRTMDRMSGLAISA
jgi:hypothetical protein